VAAAGDDTGPMMRRMLDGLRSRPLVADGLLAGLLAAFSLVALGYAVRDCDKGCEPGGIWAVTLILFQTLPLTWRRHRPLAVGLLTGLATAAYGVAPFPDLAMPIPAGGVVGLYSVAAWGSRRAALIAGGFAAVVIVVTIGLPQTDADLVDAVFVVSALAGAWVLGDRARLQRAVAAELRERAARLERERAGEARRAVAEERTRIARELHDVVAHHVSMMVVQAEAGPVAVDHDPARAAGAFDAIAATGRQALVEMRRLLGVLRGDGDQTPSLTPQPGLDQVPSLVEQVARAGLEVELVVEGVQGPLPAGVDLSAYRIVQEALTNALRHGGPGRARVLVRYGADDLRLEIHDDGPAGKGPAGGGGGGPGGNGVELASGRQPEAWSRPSVDNPVIPTGRFAGRGLLGMRERVHLFGGELRAGPDPGGGFTVEARLPTGALRS
jgi:signal transduction histidine kinase